MKNPILAPLFLGFTVLYFFMAISGYTELLFGLIVVFSIHHYLKEKYFLATLLISFLPFVRSEGYLIMPLFFIILVLRRKYLYIVLLATGNIIYSTLGFFVYDDLFWLYNQNPYDGSAADIYGHGTLFHFFYQYHFIWGKPLAFLTLTGLLYLIILLFRKKTTDDKYFKEEFFLVFGSLIVYFSAHTIFWWKGLFNSLGLERVMGAVLPVSALVSLRGFNFILSFLSKQKKLSIAFTIFIIVWVILKPFQNNYFPLRPEGEDLLVYEVKKWYENSEYKKSDLKKFYLHPDIPVQLAFDPFDKTMSDELWGLYSQIHNNGYSIIPDSTLIFWDAHYGPNEGAIPLEKIMSDKNFTLIKSFYPEEPFMVLGNHPFEIHVFQKINRKEDIIQFTEKKYDFESTVGLENTNTFSQDQAYSGRWSSKLDETSEYSAAIIENINSIKDIDNTHFIKLSLRILGSGQIESTAVISLHKDEELISYYSYPFNYNFTNNEKWTNIECIWSIDPDLIKKAKIIKLYILNYNKQTFYVDDFILKYSNNYN